MEKNSYLILDNEFLQYCKLNNIEDVEKLAKETFQRGFTQLKYGNISPTYLAPLTQEMVNDVFHKISEEKPIEEPIPVEIIEKIKEIKEIPVVIKKDIYDE